MLGSNSKKRLFNHLSGQWETIILVISYKKKKQLKREHKWIMTIPIVYFTKTLKKKEEEWVTPIHKQKAITRVKEPSPKANEAEEKGNSQNYDGKKGFVLCDFIGIVGLTFRSLFLSRLVHFRPVFHQIHAFPAIPLPSGEFQYHRIHSSWRRTVRQCFLYYRTKSQDC